MSEYLVCLADAQNFYISAERAFNGALRGRPVIVLSNGDGTIVASSEEAKALGLTRGLPFFQAHEIVSKHHVAVFSSNYPLYQSMSDRIFTLLSRYAERRQGRPHIENYSIDESYLSVAHIAPEHLLEYGRTMREHVLRATGIPLRFAFATNKQLAKVAAVLIKAHPEYEEVFSLVGVPAEALDAHLASVTVEQLWGVGPRFAAILKKMGITNALQLRDAESTLIHKCLTVTGVRIQLELRGTICVPLEIAPAPRKGLWYSRSLGSSVEMLDEMREITANYTARAAKKLRDEHRVASEIGLFVTTNPFEKRTPYYSRSRSAKLLFPTNITQDLIAVAFTLLDQVFREGLRYKRVGVGLTGIRPEEDIQPDLFGMYDVAEEAKKARLAAIMDIINGLWNREVIYFGTQGTDRGWEYHPRWLSPRFSTQWSELLVVR